MTKLKFLNVFILQWLFIRLTKCSETIATEVEVKGYDYVTNTEISSRSVGKSKVFQWYSLQGFIVPTTGWSTDYKRLGKTWFLKLTDKKEIK